MADLKEGAVSSEDIPLASGTMRTLLLVDDESSIVAALSRLLKADQYHILQANSGQDGLRLLAQNNVGVVVSDQRMPKMTGVEFLSQVKELYPDTVRIVLSGYADINSITDAINHGAIYKFLTKPWDDALFCASVAEAFVHYELLQDKKRLTRDMLSTVSHELRTPLTSIRGALGLLAGGVTGAIPNQAMGLVSIASNNCDRLVRLINDILDMDKIESGKMSFDLQPVDLRSLVEEAITANQAYAAQHQVKITVEGELLPSLIIGDRDRLIQVLTNLLSNAAKFTSPGGMVHVSLAHNLGNVVLRVRDEGPGIPEDFKSRIFQKFSQADSADTRGKGGTGLGLNITKAIVEHHGGQIGFESVAGQGTTFWVNLPALPAAAMGKRQPE